MSTYYCIDLANGKTASMGSGSAEAAYPVGNVTDGVAARVWRSTNKTGVALGVDLAAATAIDTFALINHNLRSNGSGNSIDVRQYTADTFASSVRALLKALPDDAQHHPVVYGTFDSVSKRYWWANFSGFSVAADTYDSNDDGTDDAYYEAGVFLLGSRVTLTQVSPPMVAEISTEILSHEAVAIDGTRWATQRAVIQSPLRLTWEAVTPALLGELREMYRALNPGAAPGLLVIDDSSEFDALKIGYYGRFAGPLRVSQRYGGAVFDVSATFVPESFGEVV